MWEAAATPNTALDFLNSMLSSYVLVPKEPPQGLILPQIIWFLKVKKRTRWLSKKTGHISDSNYIKMMTQFRKTQSVIKKCLNKQNLHIYETVIFAGLPTLGNEFLNQTDRIPSLLWNIGLEKPAVLFGIADYLKQEGRFFFSFLFVCASRANLGK